jgi:hypothetical protein
MIPDLSSDSAIVELATIFAIGVIRLQTTSSNPTNRSESETSCLEDSEKILLSVSRTLTLNSLSQRNEA